MKKEAIFQLLASLETEQRNKLLRLAQQHVPHITLDDLLQPNDFIFLEQDPYFRYEEGILAGFLSFRAALYALGVTLEARRETESRESIEKDLRSLK